MGLAHVACRDRYNAIAIDSVEAPVNVRQVGIVDACEVRRCGCKRPGNASALVASTAIHAGGMKVPHAWSHFWSFRQFCGILDVQP